MSKLFLLDYRKRKTYLLVFCIVIYIMIIARTYLTFLTVFKYLLKLELNLTFFSQKLCNLCNILTKKAFFSCVSKIILLIWILQSLFWIHDSKLLLIITFFLRHACEIHIKPAQKYIELPTAVKNISYMAVLLIDQFLDVPRQIYYLDWRFLCPKQASLVRALNKNS